MTKFLDLFEPIEKGNHGLTDEAIYKSIQMGDKFIPVWGAYKVHNIPDRFISENGRTKMNKLIKKFDGEGIIINFDGVSAGRMTYKKDERFALNHHAGFFKVKKGAKKKINPEFFALFYQNHYLNASVSSDQNTLTFDIIYSLEFDIPPFNIQNKIMEKIRPLLSLRQDIINSLENIKNLKNKIIVYNYNKFQGKSISCNDLFYSIGGNSGLTEEYLYSLLHEKTINNRHYKIITGSTNITDVDKIHKCNHPIKHSKKIITYEGEGIHVVRKGKAGFINYLSFDKYTITDDAYILYLKKNLKYKISLKWFVYTHRQLFFEYATSSDNGTWNKSSFMKNAIVDIPLYNDQIKLAKRYDVISNHERKIIKILKKINAILIKHIEKQQNGK